MAVQQNAVDVYNEVCGDYDRFHQVMTERGYTNMQCLSLHRDLLKEQGWIDPKQPFTPRPVRQQPIDTLSQAIEAVYKRTIIVVMEIEVDDLEDTHQTAELAVELLQRDMDNQITLIAATEKL